MVNRVDDIGARLTGNDDQHRGDRDPGHIGCNLLAVRHTRSVNIFDRVFDVGHVAQAHPSSIALVVADDQRTVLVCQVDLVGIVNGPCVRVIG